MVSASSGTGCHWNPDEQAGDVVDARLEVGEDTEHLRSDVLFHGGDGDTVAGHLGAPAADTSRQAQPSVARTGSVSTTLPRLVIRSSPSTTLTTRPSR
jgi:hypothetical protein